MCFQSVGLEAAATSSRKIAARASADAAVHRTFSITSPRKWRKYSPCAGRMPNIPDSGYLSGAYSNPV